MTVMVRSVWTMVRSPVTV